jgi:imidazolonepropionase
MGAHAVPTGEDSDTYTERVTTEQIPAVADQGIAEFCDVFCEQGVFDVAQSQRVLEAGQEAGLVPKIHAEELSHLGGTQLAADVGAASADHLLHSTREDAAACGENDVTPVFLPGTAFALGAAYADSSVFFEEGANCALATDLNPNCFSQSMGFVVALACIGMHMTPAESLVAATRNAARAINREDGTGTLRVGAPGDLVVIDAPSHVHVPYNFGTNLVSTVVADGIVVHES